MRPWRIAAEPSRRNCSAGSSAWLIKSRRSVHIHSAATRNVLAGHIATDGATSVNVGDCHCACPVAISRSTSMS